MIRNQLYPYIEQYINEYLYGFTKEQMDLAITQGKLELNKIVIRPDKINQIMDDSNVAFWVKAGIINRIYLGISLMNLIGELPLEVNIDGINMVLSPSYKWINKNLNKNTANAYTKKNPVGLNLDTKEDLEIDFDASIFNKTLLEEVFKDKTLISGIVNSLFKSLYDFYKMPNFAVILKINNINIRIEDDELFNYEGNFSLSIRIQGIKMKMGFKGNTKKNSLKIENFAVVWDSSPNLLITNKILNEEIKKGKMDDSYYQKVKDLDFSLFKDITNNDNIKYIIDNFNMTINFGTQNSETPNKDIFKVEEEFKKCYFQISSNELIINLYPEFMHYINHFSSFNSNFSVIEKIKNHRPNTKPSDDIDKKIATRNWLHYFVWAHKVQNKKTGLYENPIRAEFNRFYNIYHKKVDAIKLLKLINDKKNKTNKDNNTSEGEEINNATPSTPSGNSDEMYNLEEYAFINNLDKNSIKAKKQYEKYRDEKVKKKYSKFSSIIEVLIKGMVINMHPSIKRNVDIKNSIIVNLSGIELKIQLSPEQFNFNLGLNSFDIGPSDRIYTERVILCPTSYRQDLSNKDNDNLMPNNNLIITPGNDNDINSANDTEKREAGLTGLLKKYNPNYEHKIKIIDEALSKVDETPSFNIFNSPIKPKKRYLLRGQRNTQLNSPANSYFIYNSGLKKNLDFDPNEGEDMAYINKPRNTSFTKNMINSFTETDMNLKNKIKKQKNEIKISNAVNNYNSNNLQKTIFNLRYRNLDNINLEKSASMNLRFSNKFIYTSNKNYYKSNNINLNKGNKSPHNLLEIYSNSKIGALKLKYTKFNNSFSLDDFSIQIGTIRFNSFYQYFIDLITIVKDYQKSNNKPQIKRSYVHSMDGGGMEGTKTLLKMRQDFIKMLSSIEGKNRTETINEYIEYLKNENNKLLAFDTDIDTKPYFELNYLFSFFPKGIKFYLDYENFEGVYYNKMEKLMGKFMISPYNINISLSLSKIIVNLFGINIEINNLKESKLLIEKLMEQCQKMLADKKDMAEIIIEPCYTALKAELMNENILDDSIINNIKNIK